MFKLVANELLIEAVPHVMLLHCCKDHEQPNEGSIWGGFTLQVYLEKNLKFLTVFYEFISYL